MTETVPPLTGPALPNMVYLLFLTSYLQEPNILAPGLPNMPYAFPVLSLPLARHSHSLAINRNLYVAMCHDFALSFKTRYWILFSP